MKVRVGKKVWYPLRTLGAIGQVASVLLLSWFFFSYLEIVIKNTTGSPVYSTWNLWLKILGS